LGYPIFFLITFVIGLVPLLFIPWMKPTLGWVSKEER